MSKNPEREVRAIRPQPGFQETVLSCDADIAIVGGSAGCGKSRVLLMEPLYHRNVPGFYAVYFRRNTTQIRNPGGLWDEARQIYPLVEGKMRASPDLECNWDSGARVKFAHLEHENTVYDWQGAQVCLICCEVGTGVRMADGSVVAIEKLVVGDMVQTLNGPRRVSRAYAPHVTECVTAQVFDETGALIGSQVQSAGHAILDGSSRWTSYEDALAERATSESMGSHSVRRSSGKSDTKSQSHETRPDSLSCRSPQPRVPLQSQPGHRCESENDACTAPQGQGSDCGSCRGNISGSSQPPSVRLAIALVPRPLESWAAHNSIASGGASSCARIESALPDSQVDCPSCLRSDDVPGGHGPETSPCFFRPQVCAAERSQMCSPSGDLGTTPRRSGQRPRYAHPYTAEPRTAEVECQVGSCVLTPCGTRQVVHLSIEGEAHYITELGVVNRNCFDELTHFTSAAFWYMLSRNRSTCGVRPYVRASCNPDSDSWVAKLIAWWIDQDTGFPIPERAGVHRHFARVSDELVWGDTKAEVMEKAPGVTEVDVKSMTFIPGKLDDNQDLLRVDPGYRGRLMAMSRVERGRLLDGNWKVRAAAGMVFNRSEVKIIETAPTDLVEVVRRWDLASTEPHEGNQDPDWTCGVKMGKTKAGRYVVLDVIYFRKRAHLVHTSIKAIAEQDGHRVKVGLAQDPGQAGVDQVTGYARDLAGYTVWIERETGDKVTRSDAYATQWQAGNVDILRGPWNDWYLALMEAFPTEGVHDDPVDASSGAFQKLVKGRNIFDVVR